MVENDSLIGRLETLLETIGNTHRDHALDERGRACTIDKIHDACLILRLISNELTLARHDLAQLRKDRAFKILPRYVVLFSIRGRLGQLGRILNGV